MSALRSALLATIVSPLVQLSPATDQPENRSLAVGDPAPAIDVGVWLNGMPPQGWEPGQVYVLDFSTGFLQGVWGLKMPQLADLQLRYGGAVTVISVVDKPLVEVAEALATPVGLSRLQNSRQFYQTVMREVTDPQATYSEFTQHYLLGVDPDGSVHRDYVTASRYADPSCVFVIGQTGLVEWIGSSGSINEPLEAVVKGAWDRDAFAEYYALNLELQEMATRGVGIAEEGDYQAAEAIAQEMLTLSAREDVTRVAKWRKRPLDWAILQACLPHDQELALKKLELVIKPVAADAQQLNFYTWRVVKVAEDGVKLNDELLQRCADATEAALSKTRPEGSLLDTIAHCYYHLGDLDRAIEYQERALEDGNVGRLQMDIEAYLRRLKAEKAASE
ncbi:MAG: tetratricopeptide repeat protein [Planctomycetota bacterium]